MELRISPRHEIVKLGPATAQCVVRKLYLMRRLIASPCIESSVHSYVSDQCGECHPRGCVAKALRAEICFGTSATLIGSKSYGVSKTPVNFC